MAQSRFVVNTHRRCPFLALLQKPRRNCASVHDLCRSLCCPCGARLAPWKAGPPPIMILNARPHSMQGVRPCTLSPPLSLHRQQRRLEAQCHRGGCVVLDLQRHGSWLQLGKKPQQVSLTNKPEDTSVIMNLIKWVRVRLKHAEY